MLEIHPRKSLTPKQRIELFRAHKGMCCICKLQIKAGQPWHDDHQRALALGGTNDMSNRGPSHVHCHGEKTKKDQRMIAKAKRVEAKHFGAKVPKGQIKSRGFQSWEPNVKFIERDFDT